MPRAARVVVAGHPHHITARGNHGSDVFEDIVDRQVYLGLLKNHGARQKVTIQAYCLMTNHIHLVLTPADAQGLSRMMRSVQRGYSEYFNHRKLRGGHLWSDRYYSCVLDEEHLWAAVRYVEMNPVHAGLVQKPQGYPWSSAPAHCGKGEDALLDHAFPPAGVVKSWGRWLQASDVEQEEAIRRATEACRVAGDEKFVKKVGRLLKRDVAIRPQGRPPKDPEKR